MNKLFIKEIKLSSHPLSYFFIAFSFMFLIPGYPILCAPFFVTLGILQSFQKTRENGDILFSVLLPIPKKEVVTGKFIFILFIELCSALIMALCVILRKSVMKDNPLYISNPMLEADFSAFSSALLIFSLYNFIFVRGFFHTAYKLGLPFLFYAVSAFVVIAGAEILSHLSFMHILEERQFLVMITGLLLFALITHISYRMSVKSFLRLDL